MNISVLKLSTGEDVLSEIESESETEYVLINPVLIYVIPYKDGQPNIEFIPFPLHSDPKPGKTFCLTKKCVVYSYEPNEKYIENYNKIFGSGIITPQKKLIID
jgi:hypothetical protein